MSYFNWTEKPPSIKAILESIVNFDREEKVGLSQLAKLGRDKIFSFEYDLVENNYFTKEEFEVTILNHFIKRRIGFETIGAFKLELEVKLNEIMPRINKLISAFETLTLDNAGQTTTREKNEDNKYRRSGTNTGTNNTIIDNRYSNTPQNQLNNVQNGTYMTEYTYNQNNNTINLANTNNDDDTLKLNEVVQKSSLNKIDDYIKLIEKTKDIYKIVFDELECLFYNLR